jgi:hypothetical protein
MQTHDRARKQKRITAVSHGKKHGACLQNAVRGVVFRQRAHVAQPRGDARVLGEVFLDDGELRRCGECQWSANGRVLVRGCLKKLLARAQISDARSGPAQELPAAACSEGEDHDGFTCQCAARAHAPASVASMSFRHKCKFLDDCSLMASDTGRPSIGNKNACWNVPAAAARRLAWCQSSCRRVTACDRRGGGRHVPVGAPGRQRVRAGEGR